MIKLYLNSPPNYNEHRVTVEFINSRLRYYQLISDDSGRTEYSNGDLEWDSDYESNYEDD